MEGKEKGEKGGRERERERERRERLLLLERGEEERESGAEAASRKKLGLACLIESEHYIPISFL